MALAVFEGVGVSVGVRLAVAVFVAPLETCTWPWTRPTLTPFGFGGTESRTITSLNVIGELPAFNAVKCTTAIVPEPEGPLCSPPAMLTPISLNVPAVLSQFGLGNTNREPP